LKKEGEKFFNAAKKVLTPIAWKVLLLHVSGTEWKKGGAKNYWREDSQRSAKSGCHRTSMPGEAKPPQKKTPTI